MYSPVSHCITLQISLKTALSSLFASEASSCWVMKVLWPAINTDFYRPACRSQACIVVVLLLVIGEPYVASLQRDITVCSADCVEMYRQTHHFGFLSFCGMLCWTPLAEEFL